jgi:hypothetical protein
LVFFVFFIFLLVLFFFFFFFFLECLYFLWFLLSLSLELSLEELSLEEELEEELTAAWFVLLFALDFRPPGTACFLAGGATSDAASDGGGGTKTHAMSETKMAACAEGLQTHRIASTFRASTTAFFCSLARRTLAL